MTASPDRVDLTARLAAIRPAKPALVVPQKFPRATRDMARPCFGGCEVRS